jgi:hypothetical protein
MKLDLDFLFVCVDAQDRHFSKLAFFPQNPQNIQKIRYFLTNSSDKTIKNDLLVSFC